MTTRPGSRSPSMHTDAPLWSDVCCCAPEPRWQALADEMERQRQEQVQPQRAAPRPLAEAVFAGGCFWCVEAVFEELDGVHEVISGYTGGEQATANYRDVCTGDTGHAEAVLIRYDPARIGYEQLLEVHFATHDPTQLNRQGNDVGPQYRSAIFYADPQQQAIARAYIEHLRQSKAFGGRPIVTTLEPLTRFYPAEPYHQDYVCHNPYQPYVRFAAMPKLEKVREQFADRLKQK